MSSEEFDVQPRPGVGPWVGEWPLRDAALLRDVGVGASDSAQSTISGAGTTSNLARVPDAAGAGALESRTLDLSELRAIAPGAGVSADELSAAGAHAEARAVDPDDPSSNPYYPYDPELLRNGDRRNVVDKYRYWSMGAIREDLRVNASALHIAIENLEHDLNIGSIVRTGNAFNVGGVHIVGRRKWNRRGAMVTDKYLDIIHHPAPADLAQWARENGYTIVAVDNMEGSTQLECTELPERTLMVFGQESTGISPELLEAADKFVYIPQFGSTRSMNVAAAAAIAMHWWVAQFRV